ncbi:LacI family DNA-binding transcriptional regulator [Kribbella sandramycini]|uniref:LacI family DNA-binding transcriptional regulator n=1 Tax=Kribbella sandramycini TaxID=60450 RepID=A0A7Y4L2S9_9ACTN|nr:LacI family DNA-binding transcriptional regulator [Kribbella sandramycini]MBB6571314.1 LacI family transcriptional regulator [Kribbella sandramycini]NOL43283.1 LacI family DNA-binding transcriptional regulator [Kribbella sandramycini]
MTTGRPATIYDVAALAKLSIATVSRVLQGTGPVSEKARTQVAQAAAQLNYVPLRAARSLAVQRHEAHGLVLPDLSGPFYGDLLMGYERWAGEHGQSVVLTVTHGNSDPRRSVRDLAGRVDGIVVHGNALELSAIQELRQAGVPLVLVAHPPVKGCDSVRTESVTSAEQLTNRLLASGRRRLLFVGDPASSYDVSERYAGFARAHASRGLTADEPLRVPLTEESGRQVAAEISARGKGKRPNGLVCANDELGLAVLTTLRSLGVGVPDDVVVTGWDDVMAARYVSPGLSTVRQPMAELGRLAAQRLHERVTGERTRGRNDVLATELVLRDSCGTSGAMQQ